MFERKRFGDSSAPLLEKNVWWREVHKDPQSKTLPGYTRIFAFYLSDVSFMVKKNMQTNTHWESKSEQKNPGALPSAVMFGGILLLSKATASASFYSTTAQLLGVKGGWKQWWSHQGNHMESWGCLRCIHLRRIIAVPFILLGKVLNRLPPKKWWLLYKRIWQQNMERKSARWAPTSCN